MTVDRLSKALRTIACHLPNQFKIPLLRGRVEKVGVAPDPKRVGPVSRNLEYG